MIVRIPDQFPDLPPQEEQPSGEIYSLAYGGGNRQESDTLYRVERGTPRYRNGRLISVLPQFRALKLAVRNTNSVPTNVPLTQSSPATSPFVNTTTGRVQYPTAVKPSANAPDLP